jgi:3-deoxy-D-manno-octulosonic-acid transferase
VVILYNLFIRLYLLALRMASLRNKKAAEWIGGRKELFSRLKSQLKPEDRIIWVHCASAGELEQGKPVIEQLRDRYPNHRILLSLFSPSGYSVAKKYSGVDLITYLPADTVGNARQFLELTRPELVIFVKYEFWYHYLKAVDERKIPLLLVSAIFRKEQVFFKWYGHFFRKLLFFFRHIFVQDPASQELLLSAGIHQVSVAGDTRFDRVIRVVDSFSGLPVIPEFIGSARQVIVAGSTWPDDEHLFTSVMQDKEVKLILAPHEIHETHLQSIETIFPGSIRFSKWDERSQPAQVLIIDNIGMLSRLYHYATVTYVGGGFNKSGIHNTLEAAVHGKPVLFGPNYEKFREARELIATGAAFSIASPEELKIKTDQLLHDPEYLKKAGLAAKNYVAGHTGATETILRFIQENRLLTR